MLSINEIIMIIVCAVAVLLIFKLVKGILKFIITLILIIAASLYVFMPNKLADVSSFAKTQGFNKVQQIVNKSDSVRIGKDSENKTTISIKINNTWFDSAEIKDIISISDHKCVLKINGQRYTVTDKYVIQVIKLMK